MEKLILLKHLNSTLETIKQFVLKLVGQVAESTADAIEEMSEKLIPDGGESGQVLAKSSNEDYDLEWVDPNNGGEFSGILSIDKGGTGNDKGNAITVQTTEIQPPKNSTYYRIPFHYNAADASTLRNMGKFRYRSVAVTDDSTGRAELWLGGSEGGQIRGAVVMYNRNNGYTFLYPSATQNINIALPDEEGVLATTSSNVASATVASSVTTQEADYGNGTTYRIAMHTTKNGNAQLKNDFNLRMYLYSSSTGADTSRLIIGSDSADGNSSIGVIRIYSNNDKYVAIRPVGNLGDNRTIYFPDEDGTIATTNSKVASASVATQIEYNDSTTSGTTYRPLMIYSSSGNYDDNFGKPRVSANGFRLYTVAGTSSTNGIDRLLLGSETAQGKAGNSYGELRLYDTKTNYATLTTDSLTNNRTLKLPDKSGTLACLDDYPSRIQNSDGVGYMNLIVSGSSYYLRPGDSTNNYYVGSATYHLAGVYTEAITVYGSRITCQPTYDNTVTYAQNMYVSTSGVISRTTNTSSRTIKHDIKPLEADSYENVSAGNLYNINLVSFKYNDGIITDENDLRIGKDLPGIIIEQLNEVYPIAVDKPDVNDVKTWSWNQQYLIPPMLRLIQEQHKEIEQLKSDMETLKYVYNRTYY